MCCSRLAPIQFIPFSYFCTCWNVRPSSVAMSVCVRPSIILRILIRLPTCLSVGFFSDCLSFIVCCPTSFVFPKRGWRHILWSAENHVEFNFSDRVSLCS